MNLESKIICLNFLHKSPLQLSFRLFLFSPTFLNWPPKMKNLHWGAKHLYPTHYTIFVVWLFLLYICIVSRTIGGVDCCHLHILQYQIHFFLYHFRCFFTYMGSGGYCYWRFCSSIFDIMVLLLPVLLSGKGKFSEYWGLGIYTAV